MWSLLVLAAFLVLFKRAFILLILARLRLRPVKYQIPAGNRVEAWERELLQGAAGILAAQGFRFVGYARQPYPTAARPVGCAMAFFEHLSEPIWASVFPAEIPIPQNPFQIGYVTCFTNGRILRTRCFSGRIFPDVEGYSVNRQIPSADFGEIFAAHRKASADLERIAPAERISLAALLFLEDKSLSDDFESLRACGILVPDGAGAYRLTLRGLWAAGRAMAATNPPVARLRQAWAARKETFPLPPEAEAEAFLRIDAMVPRMGNSGKGLLMLVSLAAFSMLSGGGFSWSSGAMLLAIVFVHEMGHALAMRWVGYRDVNVFFIPFFGAVAIGRQERHPGAWQEAFILLAGPVPGLAAGAAILWAGGEALPVWAYHAAFTSVFVNGFNLLPIAPLDGGQLMQLIVFRRFPRLNKVFLVLSAVAVAGVAWWSRSPLLGFFALALLWGLYKGGQAGGKRGDGELELAGIRARYAGGRDASGGWDAGMIAEFFASFRHAKPQPFAAKQTRIKTFLAGPQDGQSARPAGIPAAAGLLAIYACIVIAPLAWYALPLFGAFYHSKAIKRADLNPAQARVYDGLCRDSAVYQISMFSYRDTLRLMASVIAPADSGRVKAFAGELAGREAVRVSVHAPIWGFGGLDPALPTALRGQRESESEYETRDSAESARYLALDSAGRAAWQDSAETVQRIFTLRLDSLRKVEEGIWESWPTQRRKEWIARWKQKRHVGPGWDCFKG